MTRIAYLNTAALDTAAKFFRVMQTAGVDFTGPMQSVAKRRNLADYLQMGCPKIDTNEDLYRLVFGDDFLSPEDMTKAYGFSYSDEQIARFTETLPDFETLRWLRSNRYILVATPPTECNLLQVIRINGNRFYFSKSKEVRILQKEKFLHGDTIRAGEWLAIRKEPHPDSRGKKWNEQVALLSDNEYAPNATEAAYAVFAFFRVREVCLLPCDTRVKTSSEDEDGRFVIGHFNRWGLHIDCWKEGEGDNHYNLGILPAFRMPS